MPYSLISIFAYAASKKKLGLSDLLSPTFSLSGHMAMAPNSITQLTCDPAVLGH